MKINRFDGVIFNKLKAKKQQNTKTYKLLMKLIIKLLYSP